MSDTAMSPASRVWIYQANRELSSEEVNNIQTAAEQFVNEWSSHGNSLMADFSLKHNYFLIFFVDEAQAKASGCSIDKSVQFIRMVAEQYDINFFDRMNVAVQRGEVIELIDYNAIGEMIKSGQLNGSEMVFNNLVQTKDEFDAFWVTPINESKLFPRLRGAEANA